MPKRFKKAACFLTVLGLLASFTISSGNSYAMEKNDNAAVKTLSNSQLMDLEENQDSEDYEDFEDMLLDIDWGFEIDESTEELEDGDFGYVVNDRGEAVLTSYVEDAKTVNVPAKLGGHPVTMIYYAAFSELEQTQTINLPEGVEVIGGVAFAFCDNLKTVNIPNTVTTIDAMAFALNYELESVTIPKSVKQIGEEIFGGCEKEVTIYGETGSYAETYAKENKIPFKAINEEKVIATGVTTANLNVRKGTSTSYAKIGYLAKGTKVEIVKKYSNGWYKIKYGNSYGYISGQYVKLNETQEEKVIATGVTTANLNVRKGTSTSYAKIGYLAKGTKVEIVKKYSNGWYKIKYGSSYGYISGQYVKLSGTQQEEKVVATGSTTVNLNVRSGPSANYGKIGSLAKGTKVEIAIRYSNGWYKIKYGSSYGYVSGAYVKLDGAKGEVIATGVTTANLNVRSGASTNYTKIGYLTKGSKVEIVTKLSNGWYKIKYGSSYGYVSGTYVKLS